ncbi:hypothetical protein [Paenibacillus mendelii]|uniref:Uncharacterized protein n=1 Tax=Paenibacillus mendelii TaxID=206163 RepID=A0ABV6J4U0_9BACL|nr:hypothetical protein [Paenibacillus mendelii]MCQ6561676.1 hypothetical protein [Paenibacillus mendelii]
MNKQDGLRIGQQQLAEAWQRTLPNTIHETDSAIVKPDEANEQTLRVTIQTAGHQMYSFDFSVRYVDSREVRVELIDVERDGRSVDERTDIIQQLIQDYTRHIHECAQTLHAVTNA